MRRLAETCSAETLDSLIKDAVKSGTRPIDGAEVCSTIDQGGAGALAADRDDPPFEV